jgi:hypothetical protein
MEIVRHLLDEFKPAQRHLFRHDSDLKKRISEDALNGARKRMGYQERLPDTVFAARCPRRPTRSVTLCLHQTLSYA